MPATERRAGACAEATSTTASGRLSAALKRESVGWKAAVAAAVRRRGCAESMSSGSPRSETSQESSVAKGFFGEVVVDTCRVVLRGGAPNGCSENDQPNSSLHRDYGGARARPRTALKAHARWSTLACRSAAPLPWLGRGFWLGRDRCPCLDRGRPCGHMAYRRPTLLLSCIRLLCGHDRCLFPLECARERGFGRLDGRNVTDQLEHLSAAVGDRPRVRSCSGRHCLCRADAAVEARADEMNACSDCFW